MYSSNFANGSALGLESRKLGGRSLSGEKCWGENLAHFQQNAGDSVITKLAEFRKKFNFKKKRRPTRQIRGKAYPW